MPVGTDWHGLTISNSEQVPCYSESWRLAHLDVYPPQSLAPPKKRIQEALLSIPKLFSIRPGWRERLRSLIKQRLFSLKVTTRRVSCTYKKAV